MGVGCLAKRPHLNTRLKNIERREMFSHICLWTTIIAVFAGSQKGVVGAVRTSVIVREHNVHKKTITREKRDASIV